MTADTAACGDPVIAAHPGGPVTDVEQGIWGEGTATFDLSRAFRFRLSRVWDTSGPRVNFLMLNPSTADAFQLDPTVRRCVGFARDWGAGSLEVTNVFALRSTDPKGLRRVSEPVGVGNDAAIVAAARAADLVVFAWGSHASYLGRERQVLDMLGAHGIPAVSLRLTSKGHPGHPLYLPADSPRTPWVY